MQASPLPMTLQSRQSHLSSLEFILLIQFIQIYRFMASLMLLILASRFTKGNITLLDLNKNGCIYNHMYVYD